MQTSRFARTQKRHPQARSSTLRHSPTARLHSTANAARKTRRHVARLRGTRSATAPPSPLGTCGCDRGGSARRTAPTPKTPAASGAPDEAIARRQHEDERMRTRKIMMGTSSMTGRLPSAPLVQAVDEWRPSHAGTGPLPRNPAMEDHRKRGTALAATMSASSRRPFFARANTSSPVCCCARAARNGANGSKGSYSTVKPPNGHSAPPVR